MVTNKSNKNKKGLNRINSKDKIMKKRVVHSKLTSNNFYKMLGEAQKDPNFIKEINKFIKATTSIHKL